MRPGVVSAVGSRALSSDASRRSGRGSEHTDLPTLAEAEITPDASVAYFEEDTHSLWIPVLSVDVRDASGIVPACGHVRRVNAPPTLASVVMSTRGCGGVSSCLNALGADVF